MKIKLIKNMVMGSGIKPAGAELSVPDDIGEDKAGSLIDMGKAVLVDGEALAHSLDKAQAPPAAQEPVNVVEDLDNDLAGGEIVVEPKADGKGKRAK